MSIFFTLRPFAHDRFKPIFFPRVPSPPSCCLNNKEIPCTARKAVTPRVSIEIRSNYFERGGGKLPIESRFRWKERRENRFSFFFFFFIFDQSHVASNKGQLITLDFIRCPLFGNQKLRGCVYRNRGCGTQTGEPAWCNLRFSQVRQKLLTLRPNWV